MKSKIVEFKNESGLQFTDISTEVERVYVFPGGSSTRIGNPTHLNVSDSGGHRIFDADGVSHYIPTGWIHLYWMVKDGAPNFIK